MRVDRRCRRTEAARGCQGQGGEHNNWGGSPSCSGQRLPQLLPGQKAPPAAPGPQALWRKLWRRSWQRGLGGSGLGGRAALTWDEGVVRGEGPGGALSVHQQPLQLPIHHVLLHLRLAQGRMEERKNSRRM